MLIVDDDASVRTALLRVLQRGGFACRDAASAALALELLGSERFDVMLTDVHMPGMSGVELVPRARIIDEDLAILMLSGVNEVAFATEAMKLGALDYLVKPASSDQLVAALTAALHRRSLDMERRRVERVIREEVELRTADLQREKRSLRTLTVNVVQTLVNAMEAKDIYLRGHSIRVADLAAAIAEEMGLDADTVELIRVAGHLHDVGKMGIREEILNKPGPLTPDEFAHVKEHVRIGMAILEPLRHLGPALEYVHDHHENMDGSGYPRGLAGVAISVGGRVLAAADAFDAMRSKRAYRGSMPQMETLAVLRQQVGIKLDGRVLEALERVVTRNLALSYLDDTAR
ncbi:MAG TPA: HD domain-containing phosphohydrolase [Gemmatimonadaceae bacterium]|nr:HD domain-containing phosphohydrolase [Gemmatimonadaceae bacterium]